MNMAKSTHQLNTEQLITWAQTLQALAQNGLAYTKDHYDRERFIALRQIAGEILSASAFNVDPDLIENFTREAGYATPKIDVRAAVFDRDQLLLVKERSDGKWSLPGGWADVGSSPSAAAIREVHEESGYTVAVKKLAALYDRNLQGHPPMAYHVYKVFFICELQGGSPQTDSETEAVSFFREDALPSLSLPRVTPKQIEHLFGHYRHPEWPTSFD